MAKFQVIVLALALFAVTYAKERLEYVGKPGRDDWFRHTETYTDLPRIFDDAASCPAERYYLDCNECHCVKEGTKQATCTAKACPEVPQIVNWNNGLGGVPCPAGRHFYWKCNDCFCDNEGKNAMCTRKGCPNLDD